MNSQLLKHPKGLYVLFSTEMWERFNFYGMRAILALYFTECLGFTTAFSAKVMGGFLGLSYLSCMLGGYLADNVWGNKKCLMWGGLAMSLAQICLFISASNFHSNLAFATSITWVGLGIFIIGVGLFKPNISGMVGMLYDEKDKRLDSAYTIFYMGINLGAFIGMTICSMLADVKDTNGIRDLSTFKWGFLAAAIAILIGLVVYLIFSKKHIINPHTGKVLGLEPNKKNNEQLEKKPFNLKKLSITILFNLIFIPVFYFLLRKSQDFDFFALIYGFIYSLGISLVIGIYSDKGLSIPEKKRIGVIIICSFFVIFFWAAFEQAAASLTYIADKQTDTTIFGFQLPPTLVQNANSFFIILLSPFLGFLWVYLQSKKSEPLSYTKQAIGILMLSLGYFLIALRVKTLGLDDKMSVLWLFLLYFFHTVGELCLSPIGLSIVYRLAPKRLLSVLMSIWFLANAAGYALSGTLGALLPPTTDKYVKAKTIGVDLKQVLEHPETSSPETLLLLTKNQIPTQFPSIIGIQIQNLYDFFMCFVVMCVSASILLFVLSKKLHKMENSQKIASS